MENQENQTTELKDENEMKVEEAYTEQQVLEALLKSSNKQLFYARIRTLCSLIVAVIIAACAIIVVPSALDTIKNADAIIVQASSTITLADTAIESITEMSTSITEMGGNMDTFITDNSETVTAVMTKMEGIDFEGLNDAIKDLGDVIEPLANFFNRFN